MEKSNILMVDDQPGKLLTYEAILSSLGENLLKAHSANEALECLLKTDVAVLLIDVCMPEIDGFKLADMIMQHPRFRETAIIFISGILMSDSDRMKGYEHGAVDYISVPIIPELLRAKVKVFAELHRKDRQLKLLYGEMQRLSSRLLVTQDEERRRIARELHDVLGQELSAAKMAVDGIKVPAALGRAAEASKLIDNALKQVRSISYLLHPPLLDEMGLRMALGAYLEGLAKRSGISTSLHVPEDFPRCVPEMENAIYRVVQEALTNAFRHSEARKVDVILKCSDGLVTIAVRDDGKGIPAHVSNFRPGSVGVGIAGMRQRVAELGGILRLENTNPGTVVAISFPARLVKDDGRSVSVAAT